MNILIASDSFKDVYNPVEACDIIAGALSGIQAKLVKLPMCDGGEYAYEVLRDSFHYEERVLEGVLNAYGKQMQVRYLVNGSEAHVISSEVVRLYPHEEAYKNPLLLTDYGIGQIINEVIQEGYTKIQLYLGGTSTVCAGMGMVQALGARFFSYSNEIMPAPIRGKDLKNIKRIEYEPQNNAVTLSVIVDGNAKAYEMEGITNLKIGKTFNVERREILKTCNKGIRNIINVTGVLENQDFSGAAGGILFGIEQCFRNVSYCLGSDYFAQKLRLEDAVQSSDLVITGEGRLDNTACGKAPSVVMDIAKKNRVPLWFVCGQVSKEIADSLKEGIINDSQSIVLKNMGISKLFTCQTYYNQHPVEGGYEQQIKTYREKTPRILKDLFIRGFE